jgi:hypothetical protein
MRFCTVTLSLVAVALFASAAQASITDYIVAADGDPVITCTSTWAGGPQELTIDGIHNTLAPGHILSETDRFEASSIDDPTIVYTTSMLNDTGIAWTGYQIKLGIRAKTAGTALSSLNLIASSAALPTGWSAAVTQPLTLTNSYADADGRILDRYYIGIIDYAMGSGAAVADGESLDMAFTASFKGATSYVSWQEMTPVPEPATLSLLAIGGAIALIRRRHAK